MNRRIKKLWVEKLMSGKIEQTFGGHIELDSRGRLTRGCVLRVLADCLKDNKQSACGLLSNGQLQEAGLTVKGVCEDHDAASELLTMNDCDRMPFPVLAGFINENL